MEKLTKKRRVIRLNVKKVIADFGKAETEADLRAKLFTLNALDDQLKVLDEEILDLMLDTFDETDCVEESSKALELSEERSKWRLDAEERLNFAKIGAQPDDAASLGRGSVNSDTSSIRRRELRLPKIELEKFDLSPKNYLSFWAQFQGIHEDPSLDERSKFLYLRMTLSGTAKNVLETYSNTPENYCKALEHLKERFGRISLIINAIYKDLLELLREKPSLPVLYDTVTSKLRGLEMYGLTTAHTELLIPLIEENLPIEVLKIWERLNVTDNKLTELLKFLRKEAELEEKLNQYVSSEKTEILPTAAALVSVPSKPRNVFKPKPQRVECVFCAGSHFTQDCRRDTTMGEKRQVICDKKLCFRCLRPGHSRRVCKKQITCRKCGLNHYDIMCQGRETEKTKITPNGEGKVQTMVASAKNFHSQSLMPTLCCYVGNERIRILLDTASHRSYATKALIQRIKPEMIGTEKLHHMVFGGTVSNETIHSVYKLQLLNSDRSKKFEIQVLDQERICGELRGADRSVVSEIRKMGIILEDDDTNRPIDLLIGADAMGRFVIGLKVIRDGLLAYETVLGWTVMGVPSEKNTSSVVCSMLINSCNFWDLETLGIEMPTKKNDNAASEIFDETVEFANNKYEVVLPWIESHPPLATNKEIAMKRLKSVVDRLERSKTYELYDNVFKQWQSEGIIEEIEIKDTGHFLPHRPIIKEGKTTKIRPVFDASCKGYTDVSLNDCLEIGPNMISELIPLLIRFRMHNIGVTADIAKAFLMIGLKSERDRDMLKFIWYRDGKYLHFRHCRVVFGLTCSPFLLNATIQYHLRNYEGKFVDDLRKSFYMDDCISSFHSVGEAQEFAGFATKVMSEANFDLRGWTMTNENKCTKVLGVQWEVENDTLSCKANVNISVDLTKRKLLSLIHKFFDPLGFVAAPLLFLKLAFQETVQLKLNWEDQLPAAIERKAISWFNEIQLLGKIQIPRCLEGSTADLHVFCDASKQGFGACIFARFWNQGKIHLRLVAAKARIAPQDPSMTIPRKELVAALIGSRLSSNVKKTLINNHVTFWTDSTIVLYWIRGGEWRTFVGNRVKEIRSLTDANAWRLVPGEMNPADIVSRGCLISEYVKSKWWEGPEWLLQDKENWPKTEIIPTTLEATNTCVISELEIDVDRFVRRRRYSQNIRILAYVMRFVQRLKRNKTIIGEITHDEFKAAEMKIILLVQRLSKTEVGGLNTLTDEQGLLRVKTKILSNEFDPEFRTPLLLPKSIITEDLLRETHEKNFHAPANTTISLLRDRFWIVKGRQQARKIISACIRCRRFKARHFETPPIGLPDNRVNLGKPFEISGCDLAGPLFVKEGGKVWIVLFTCAVYRAIHLEVVNSLSTEAFLLSLRRFIARRGRVRIMYSDNGTNFTGAWRLIRQVDIEEKFKIQWKFNAPTGAWWGGFFERLIGLVKDLLRASLGRALLTSIELSTVLTEIEGVINSRPITMASEDTSDLEPLCPSMFLSHNFDSHTVDLDCIDTNHLRMRLKYLNQVRESLKNRFRQEYLGKLLLGSSRSNRPIEIGEVVLIHSTEKRMNWLMGKVTEVFPGRDGITRVAKLKTKNGEMLRPVQRLYPLECTIGDVSETENETKIENKTSPIVVSRSGRVIKPPKKLDL